MNTPNIYAALERLVELDSTSITMRSKQSSLAWSDAIATARAALAQPEGGPTYREIMALRDELDTEGYGTVDLVAFARATLARWGNLTVPPLEPENLL